MQCSVSELEGSKPGQKKIKLSLDPKEVNSGLSKSSLKQGMVCLNSITVLIIVDPSNCGAREGVLPEMNYSVTSHSLGVMHKNFNNLNCFHFLFQVLPGYVSSVEDHGYLISFGIEDTRAFLPKKNVKEGIF